MTEEPNYSGVDDEHVATYSSPVTDHSYVCPVPGCKPENHDLCMCGHDRMDHLDIPVEEGGGCWGDVGCYPACEYFCPATQEQADYYFKHFMKMVNKLQEQKGGES